MDAGDSGYRAGEQEPKKKLLTTTGTIVVHKESVLAKASRNFSITPMLQEQILRIGQEVVYSKASELIGVFNSIDVTAKQVDRVCHFYGRLLHEAELRQHQVPLAGRAKKAAGAPVKPKVVLQPSHEHLRALSRPGRETSDDLLYVMMDGSFLQFRSEDGTHKDIWKEIKIGRIFLASQQVKEVSKNRNLIRYSDYVVNLGNVKPFFEKMESRLDGYKGPLVFINDGASWIWNWVEDAYPKAVQILDYFHAMEYLNGFADAYYTDPLQKGKWIKAMADLLNTDCVEKVIEAHVHLKATDKAIQGEAKEKLNALLSYYQNNKKRMLYGSYRKNGYLVGSGPIESANRNVIQKRLKLSGQRWTEQGAQHMACLRAFIKSMRLTDIQALIRAA